MDEMAVGVAVSGYSSACSRAADLAEVVGQDSPADPTLHAGLTVIAAATESVAALQDADATFDAGSEAARPPKRRALLKFAASRAAWTLVR